MTRARALFLLAFLRKCLESVLESTSFGAMCYAGLMEATQLELINKEILGDGSPAAAFKEIGTLG